jgi:hypothetical protein
MVAFAKMAKIYNADITYTEYLPGDSDMGKNYNKMAVSMQSNIHYNHFVKTIDYLLRNALAEKESLAVGFRDLKPISTLQWFRYRVADFLNLLNSSFADRKQRLRLDKSTLASIGAKKKTK